MILETAQVRLRPFREEDLGQLHQWQNDEQIRFLAMMHPFAVSLAQSRGWLDAILHDRTNQRIYFAVEAKRQGQLIGYVNFMEINLQQGHAMMGIVIAESASRGQGLGRGIMSLGLTYAFHHLNLAKLSGDILEENLPALKLCEKMGFKREDTDGGFSGRGENHPKSKRRCWGH